MNSNKLVRNKYYLIDVEKLVRSRAFFRMYYFSKEERNKLRIGKFLGVSKHEVYASFEFPLLTKLNLAHFGECYVDGHVYVHPTMNCLYIDFDRVIRELSEEEALAEII